jgi:hypothetical protein
LGPKGPVPKHYQERSSLQWDAYWQAVSKQTPRTAVEKYRCVACIARPHTDEAPRKVGFVLWPILHIVLASTLLSVTCLVHSQRQ